MGGSKSKPAVESASSVLKRRSPHTPTTAQSTTGSIGRIVDQQQNTGIQTSLRPKSVLDSSKDSIDPSILKEMSKWSMVKTTTEKVQLLVHLIGII